MEAWILDLSHSHNTIGVQAPVTSEDDQVPEVSQRTDGQRLDGLVQLEGVVGGAGDEAGDDDDVGEAVVDDAAQQAVDQGEDGEEIQGSVDGIATSSGQKLT